MCFMIWMVFLSFYPRLYNIMHLPSPLRRQGMVPGLARLVSLILECISIVILAINKDPYGEYTTDYIIVSLVSHG